MSTQVHPDGKGGMSTTKADPPMPPGAPGAEPPGKKKAKPIGKLDVPPGFKEMMSPMLSKLAEQLGELADAVSSSTPTEIADDGEMPGVPGEFSAALESIQGKLGKIASMWPSSPAAASAEGEEELADAPTEMQMRAALDNVSKVFAHPKIEKSVVTKIGSKMAKDRFARLQQAAATLTSLIGELGSTPAPAAAPAPAGALGKGDTAALLKSFEAMLTPVIQGLEVVAKATGAQRAELESIKKSRGVGNAATNVEGAGAPTKEFSWPLDINNPVSKETVSKTESFFGDDR